jgi:hypothetical protein
MAFRRKIESGVTIKDESPIEKEWRDMWKSANSCWSESEGVYFKSTQKVQTNLFFSARWRKEDSHKRTASRNDDAHFHTAHSDSRSMSIVSHLHCCLNEFESEIGERGLG